MPLHELSTGLLYEDWLRKSRDVSAEIEKTPSTNIAALQRLAGQNLLIRSGIMGTVHMLGQDKEVGRKWIERFSATSTQRKAFLSLLPGEATINSLRPLRQQESFRDSNRCKDSDIDDFLEAYPHACQSIMEGESDDESMSDNEVEQEQIDLPSQEPLTNLKTHDPSVPSSATSRTHFNNEQTAGYDVQSSYSSYASAKPPPRLSQTAIAPATAHFPAQQLQQPHDHRTDINGAASWTIQQDNVGNPFQTAAEYARIGSNGQHQLPPQTQYGSSQASQIQQSLYVQQPMQHSGFNPYANSHYPNNSSVSSSPPPPPALVIRDSLKRKYQPPIKKPIGAVGEQTANSKNINTARTRQPPAANSTTSNYATTENNNAVAADNDDELPEPLQRYGKDLVNKIRDEIMDPAGSETITFDDIAGLANAKQTVQEVVCWPMKRPDLFTGLRRAPNGLLLFGPPGTGKTLIGKAIAHEAGATFFSISSSSLTSKWIGEGEKLVRTLFAVAAYYAASVIFVDELDSLLTQRKADENEASRRIKTEFLVQLDGTGTEGQGRVLMIGATNRPQELDEAARRRFTKRLYIPLPEEDDRKVLLQVLLAKNKHALTIAEIERLAKDTDGFSGADLKALCTDAAMGPIRALGARALEVDCNDVPAISYKHFRQSLRSMNPSVAPSDLEQYLAWDELYGSKRAEAVDETDED
ncbi:hypothetical protein MPSEU_000568000 [Mayamaea pseudoterrestris]|nr:hypothetical protein MPSEU_000568000 [Mayamaea pseudoterrestris]